MAVPQGRSAASRQVSWWAALFCLLLFATACEPPGKPEPEVPPQDVSDFKILFADNCAGCHGAEGKNGPARILNDALYLAILPRDTLKQILIHGRPTVGMPAWAKSEGGPLTPQQIDVLVNGIEQNWAQPVDFHGAPPPSYNVGANSVSANPGNADAGRKLFTRNCYLCHAPGLNPGPITDPAYLSLVSNQMLRTSTIVGRPDLGMPDYRHLKLGKALSDDEITDVVAFLVSKRPAGVQAGSMSEWASGGESKSVPAGATPNESGSGVGGATSKGNEGSGNGPGSPRQQRGEGNKSSGSSSQQGIK